MKVSNGIAIRKRDFPSFGKLACRFSLEKLLEAFRAMEHQELPEIFQSALRARHDVARHFPFESGGYHYLPLNAPLASSPETSAFHEHSTLQKARMLLGPEVKVPIYDERSYTEFLPQVPEDLRVELGKIQGKIARARFVTLKGGQVIEAHVDHPLHISVRIHIPIITNNDVLFYVQREGQWEQRHLPADGSAYFLNTAFPHKVVNAGGTDRLHLVLNLTTFEDIQHLRIERTA